MLKSWDRNTFLQAHFFSDCLSVQASSGKSLKRTWSYLAKGLFLILSSFSLRAFKIKCFVLILNIMFCKTCSKLFITAISVKVTSCYGTTNSWVKIQKLWQKVFPKSNLVKFPFSFLTHLAHQPSFKFIVTNKVSTQTQTLVI